MVREPGSNTLALQEAVRITSSQVPSDRLYSEPEGEEKAYALLGARRQASPATQNLEVKHHRERF